MTEFHDEQVQRENAELVDAMWVLDERQRDIIADRFSNIGVETASAAGSVNDPFSKVMMAVATAAMHGDRNDKSVTKALNGVGAKRRATLAKQWAKQRDHYVIDGHDDVALVFGCLAALASAVTVDSEARRRILDEQLWDCGDAELVE